MTFSEIEEIRHESSGSSVLGRPIGRLESALSNLRSLHMITDQQATTLESSSSSLIDGDDEIREDIADVQKEWTKLSGQYAAIEDEMKEDGWLVRFRT